MAEGFVQGVNIQSEFILGRDRVHPGGALRSRSAAGDLRIRERFRCGKKCVAMSVA